MTKQRDVNRRQAIKAGAVAVAGAAGVASGKPPAKKPTQPKPGPTAPKKPTK